MLNIMSHDYKRSPAYSEDTMIKLPPQVFRPLVHLSVSGFLSGWECVNYSQFSPSVPLREMGSQSISLWTNPLHSSSTPPTFHITNLFSIVGVFRREHNHLSLSVTIRYTLLTGCVFRHGLSYRSCQLDRHCEIEMIFSTSTACQQGGKKQTVR